VGGAEKKYEQGGMMSRHELTIAGLGGQGSIMAGVILGSAAVSYDRKFAVQTQAYSSELRGGFAAAWVIIADEPVVFPRVTVPDILVAQAQDSITRFAHLLKPEGILIFDTDMIAEPPPAVKHAWGVPATSIARNQVGLPITANMVMLGAMCRTTALVTRKALEAAIKDAVPPDKTEINLKAFDLGYERVKSVA
jgi:2-oxoglutarate ferredoxin oxidoreductase subunit gamma